MKTIHSFRWQNIVNKELFPVINRLFCEVADDCNPYAQRMACLEVANKLMEIIPDYINQQAQIVGKTWDKIIPCPDYLKEFQEKNVSDYYGVSLEDIRDQEK